MAGLLLAAWLAADVVQANEATGLVLEEVVVTARRRDEPLQRTPVSVTAFTQDDIESMRVVDLAGLASYTPNLELDFTTPLSGSANSSSVFIRGIGQTDYVPNKDPGVGIYQDGVYVARSVGSVLNLLDVERVEVLRGPQGTLFGKNTVGGAINVVMAKPGPDPGGEVELTLGSFDRTDLRGYVNLPLAPTLAVRASIGLQRRDGYLDRILVGDTYGDDHEDMARLALRWTPDPSFTADLAIDWSQTDERSAASKLVDFSLADPDRPGPPPNPPPVFSYVFYNFWIGGCPGPCGPLLPLPADTPPYDRRWLTDDPYTTLATGPNYSTSTLKGSTLTLGWDTPNGLWRSITGYRSTESNFSRDPDGSPLSLVHSEIWVDYTQLSQEVQWLGQALEERLDYVAGVFYLDEDGRQRDRVPFADELFLLNAAMGNPVPNFLFVNGEYSLNDIESVALYGEASWTVSPRWELTAGLRWTDERRSTTANTTQGGQFTVIDRHDSVSYSETTGRLIGAFRASDTLMVYGSYSQGFKSGGFNHRIGKPPAAPPLARPTGFGPETVGAYELGLKAEFLDGRGQLATAVFHSLYDDIQVVVVDQNIPRTVNAAEAKIDGFELEVHLAPTPRWRVDLAYGFLDARYTRLREAIPSAYGDQTTFLPFTRDSAFVNSPRHTLAAGAQANVALTGNSSLQFRFDARYRDDVANDAENTPQLIQDAFWLLGASMAWQPAACTCEVVLFGENLSDEAYFVSGTSGAQGLGSAEVIMARPREWGVRLRWRFD